ncbi:MAG TPA: nuclear transport factor 2 family protein [Steroidobacteraceae bacterium]
MRTLGLCGAVALSGCATTALMEQELTKTNTQTVLAFEATVFNKHDVQAGFEHYIGEGFIEHDARLSADPENAYRAVITREPREAHRTFMRSIAQGQLVATQSLWERGGGTAALTVVDIYRLREGRIVEHWAVAQEAGQSGKSAKPSDLRKSSQPPD